MRDRTDYSKLNCGGLRCFLHLMTISMQKKLRSPESFNRYWWLKNPAIWLDERHNRSYPNKRWSSILSFFLPFLRHQTPTKLLNMQSNVRSNYASTLDCIYFYVSHNIYIYIYIYIYTGTAAVVQCTAAVLTGTALLLLTLILHSSETEYCYTLLQ